MAQVLIYDPASSPVANRVIGYRRSVPASDFDLVVNKIIYDTDGDPAEILALAGIPTDQWVVDGGAPREMSQPEKDLVSAAQAAAALAGKKVKALAVYKNDTNAREKAHRAAMEAIVELTLSEINILRGLHSLAPRTNAAVKNAFDTLYEEKINAIT